MTVSGQVEMSWDLAQASRLASPGLAGIERRRPTATLGDKPAGERRPVPQLVRGMGLGSAVSLNMLDMIGVGPFITLPLVVTAMRGPQAMLGWVAGAALAMCDGLVVAELGASMPQAGGSYEYLKQIYGPKGLGVWFLFFLSGNSHSARRFRLLRAALVSRLTRDYLWPNLRSVLLERNLHLGASAVWAASRLILFLRRAPGWRWGVHVGRAAAVPANYERRAGYRSGCGAACC